MRRLFRAVIAVFVLAAFVAALQVDAQPRDRGQRGPGGGGMRINATMLLGVLAMEDKLNVTDPQLIALRAKLKPIHAKERELLADARGGDGDFQDTREQMMALRGELMDAVSSVLDDGQVEALKQQIQDMQSRGRRGGGRERGQRE